MGKRGPTGQRTLGPTSGWLEQPRIDRERAGEILGAEVPSESWDEVLSALQLYQFKTARLRAMKPSRKKGDPQAYEPRRAFAWQKLQQAQASIEAVRRDPHACMEFGSAASKRTNSVIPANELSRRLDAAIEELGRALDILHFAEGPLATSPPSEADCKKALVHAIREALGKAGLPIETSGGASYEYANPKPFECLILALDIHQEQSTPAWLKWLDRALSD